MQDDDEALQTFLRTALPTVRDQRPSRDMWPLIVARTSATTPAWSLADWSAAAVVVVALLLFPKWFWFLAYHL